MLRDRDLRFPIAAIENESVAFFPCPCFLFHKHRRELRTPTGLGPFQNKGIRFWYFRSIWVTKVFFGGGKWSIWVTSVLFWNMVLKTPFSVYFNLSN
jgi:hypothetical protein